MLAFALREPGAAASTLEAILERAGAHSLVALRNGLLCAVVDCDGPAISGAPAVPHEASTAVSAAPTGHDDDNDPIELARRIRARAASPLRRGARRRLATRCLLTTSGAASTRRAAPWKPCAWPTARAPEVASHKDLGAFQLLLSLQDDDALASYCQSVLGPVEADEGEYGDELLRSLDVFIEQNGHWERAAQALYCHRHTLRYRIKRVEALTGRDFSQRARPHRVLARAAGEGAGAVRCAHPP